MTRTDRISPLVREAIYHLFFGEQWTIDDIAEELQVTSADVRRVLIVDGERLGPRRSRKEPST